MFLFCLLVVLELYEGGGGFVDMNPSKIGAEPLEISASQSKLLSSYKSSSSQRLRAAPDYSWETVMRGWAVLIAWHQIGGARCQCWRFSCPRSPPSFAVLFWFNWFCIEANVEGEDGRGK